MHLSRRALLSGLSVAALASCQRDPGQGGTPSPTPTLPKLTPSPTIPSSPAPTPSSTTPTVWPALTEPGEARKAVQQLQATANLPVVKIDITTTQATLSALDERQPRAWRWSQGQVNEVESDIEYIEQSSFDPADFDFDDVGALFAQAADMSGSSASQELQIVEQTPGSVMMVVTTRPESVPVFFRPDASLVNHLDFLTDWGLREALDDAIAGRTQLTVIALTRESVYAESVDPHEPENTLRITRQRRVPAFRTSLADASNLGAFGPSEVNLAMLLETMRTLPAKWQAPRDAVVTWVIDRRDGRPLPTIRFTLDGRTMVTDMQGRDITSEV
ncbi:hypothetical protein ACPCG0_05190 [Propionibacteriaceae bacterium Y1923]